MVWLSNRTTLKRVRQRIRASGASSDDAATAREAVLADEFQAEMRAVYARHNRAFRLVPACVAALVLVVATVCWIQVFRD